MAKKKPRRLSVATARKQLSRAYDRFQDEMYKLVKAAIIAACDKHGWDFRALYFTRVFPRGDPAADDIDPDKNPAVKALLELVCDADQLCGFPDCMYENGVWKP